MSTIDPITGAVVPDPWHNEPEPNRKCWGRWFAWYPVEVHGKRTWLTFVYRRKVISYITYDDWNRFEYGTIFDVLSE